MFSAATTLAAGRAPQGARGLKSEGKALVVKLYTSRPARGAWVEMMISTA